MAKAPPSAKRDRIKAFVPALVDYTDDVIYGEVWERPGLSKRDRSLITVAALIATYRPEQLVSHLERAMANGISKEEIAEVITHLAFYSRAGHRRCRRRRLPIRYASKARSPSEDDTMKLLYFDDFRLGVLKGDYSCRRHGCRPGHPASRPARSYQRIDRAVRQIPRAPRRGRSERPGQTSRPSPHSTAAAEAGQYRLHGRQLHGRRDAVGAGADQRLP